MPTFFLFLTRTNAFLTRTKKKRSLFLTTYCRLKHCFEWLVINFTFLSVDFVCWLWLDSDDSLRPSGRTGWEGESIVTRTVDFRTKTRFPLPCAPYWTWWQCCLNSQGTLLFFSAFSWYNEKLALRFLTAWRILYFGPRLVNKHWLPNGADSPSCSRNVKHLFSFMYVVIIVIRIN